MDKKFDKVVDSMFDVGDDSDGDTDETTDIDDKKMTISYSELENLKQKEREKNGYEYMSDEQKEYFDNNLEQKCDELFDIDEDTKDQDQIYESEDSKVKKLIR